CAIGVIGVVRGGQQIALVISLSMVLIVVVGSLIGMLLPFLLSRFRLDPATASTPLVTSIADATGVLIYFSIASVLLNMPPARQGPWRGLPPPRAGIRTVRGSGWFR